MAEERLHQLRVVNRGMAGGASYRELFMEYFNAGRAAPAPTPPP